MPKHTSLLRWTLGAFGVLLGISVFLVLGGMGFETLAAQNDARRYPPPGQMIDVGGYRLHLNCTGSGEPTVILDAGLGKTSLDWSLIQPELAHDARVCSYDRAGMGWSDPGPQPRTPERIADELHVLLHNANITGRYVLVAHSLAGKNVRIFASRHPNEVAGMVLVDARHEYVDANTSPADANSFLNAVAGQGRRYALARRMGIVRLFGASLVGEPRLETDVQQQMALLSTASNTIDATNAEARERVTSDALLQAAPSLGDRPLIVIAASQSMATIPHWPEGQQRLASISNDARLVIADGSSHAVQIDQPDLVIASIREVIAKARLLAPEDDKS